jgi:hypothetical protein
MLTLFAHGATTPHTAAPRRLLLALSAVAVLTAATPAHADVFQTFYLQDFNFADGGSATGNFTVDESVGSIFGTSITVTDANLTTSPFTITDGNVSSQFMSGSEGVGIFSSGDGEIGLGMALSAPIGFVVDALTTGSSFVYDGFGGASTAILAGAALSPSPVPEPASLPILAAAIGALLLGRRWRLGNRAA